MQKKYKKKKLKRIINNNCGKMEEGFIISDKVRMAVFLEIASGEKSITRIVKKHHLIEHVAKNALEELKKHGLIEDKEGLKLTNYGMKIYGKLKGKDIIK